MTNVSVIGRKPNQEAINTLKEIIEKIEKCEITGVSIVYENADGTYNFDGSNTLSRLQTVGILMELAVQRLK